MASPSRREASVKYTIHGIEFRTQKALREHCSRLLKLPTLDADAQSFLRELLERHPERDIKVGCGVARVYIGGNDFGKRCFWIERIDGSRTDFSFISCISPPSHESEVRTAMRRHIDSQIIAFRDHAFSEGVAVACAITGQLVANEDAHIDHRPPNTFHTLVDRFLASESREIRTVAVEPTRDGVTAWGLADLELAARWSAFHAQYCDLQVVTKRANLSQGSRPRS
ncbi:MAG: DCL family protein [Labilithrix sp.]|nr:DCL family protein [Labilithrix sp.]